MGHYPSLQLKPRTASWHLLALPVAIAGLIGVTVATQIDDSAPAEPNTAVVVDFEIEQTLTELEGRNSGRALSGLSRSEVVVGSGDNVLVGDESTCIEDGPALVSDVTATMVDEELLMVEAVMVLSVECEPNAHIDADDLADSITTLRVNEMIDLSHGGPQTLTFEVTDGIDQGSVTLTVLDSAPVTEQV